MACSYNNNNDFKIFLLIKTELNVNNHQNFNCEMNFNNYIRLFLELIKLKFLSQVIMKIA